MLRKRKALSMSLTKNKYMNFEPFINESCYIQHIKMATDENQLSSPDHEVWFAHNYSGEELPETYTLHIRDVFQLVWLHLWMLPSAVPGPIISSISTCNIPNE